MLKWIVERLDGRGSAVETPIGRVPAPGALDLILATRKALSENGIRIVGLAEALEANR